MDGRVLSIHNAYICPILCSCADFRRSRANIIVLTAQHSEHSTIHDIRYLSHILLDMERENNGITKYPVRALLALQS